MNNKFKIYKNLFLITQIGLVFMISVLLSIFLGNIIDEKFNSGNIFKVIFIIIGVVSGFASVFKIIMNSVEK